VGATTAQDLITAYAYNAFGDLFRTTLPQGNLIEYGYDSARRLISIERKPNAATPGERTLYTLDKFGHRIKEEKQRWNGTAWVTDSFTSFVYSSRCQSTRSSRPTARPSNMPTIAVGTSRRSGMRTIRNPARARRPARPTPTTP
jgi:YD repeat-containing protein